MNVPEIDGDPIVAAEKADEYREAFEKSGDPEHEALAEGFEAIADGERLISLAQVFESCPADANNRPKLAIARADRRLVYWNGSSFQADIGAQGPKAHHSVIPIRWRLHSTTGGYAPLPLIPPAIREGRRLTKHFILWEVEEWAQYRSDMQPDRDPYLLKRVNAGLDLFRIVAEWELTALERWAAEQRLGTR